RPRVDGRPDPEGRRPALAARHRDADRGADAGKSVVVFGGPDGLLEPAEVEALERSADTDRLLDGPRAVRVEHQLDPVAGDLPRPGDGLDVDLVEFDRGVAEADRRRHGLPDVGRRLVPEEARVDAQA